MTNDDILKGKWKQLQGKVQQKWGKLTNDEIDQLEGSQEELEGLLQERYGVGSCQKHEPHQHRHDNQPHFREEEPEQWHKQHRTEPSASSEASC